jgi:hypothetical protein
MDDNKNKIHREINKINADLDKKLSEIEQQKSLHKVSKLRKDLFQLKKELDNKKRLVESESDNVKEISIPDIKKKKDEKVEDNEDKKVEEKVKKLDENKIILDKSTQKKIKKKPEKTVVVTKQKTIKKTNEQQRKSSTKKKRNYILPSILIISLICIAAFLFYLKNNLNKEKLLLQEEDRIGVDLNKDTYYRDVDDEVKDEELMDLEVYKDVPDSNNPANNTTTNTQNQNNSTDIIVTNGNLDTQNNQTTEPKVEEAIKDTVTNRNEPILVPEKPKTNTPKDELIIINYTKIFGQQLKKNGELIIPSRKSKINSFNIRVRLNKPQNESKKPVTVKVTIRNSSKKILKVDSKTVNFKTSTIYVNFLETISEKLDPKENYTLLISVDNKLLKTVTIKI